MELGIYSFKESLVYTMLSNIIIVCNIFNVYSVMKKEKGI